MEFISNILDMGIYVLPFLAAITVMVFFHELGHYLVARFNGVRVEAFSIGFGPQIFGWHDSKKTHWKVCWIPLGGYVKMAGDMDASSKVDHKKLKSASKAEREGFMNTKNPGAKIAISMAGPVANFILTFFLFAGVILFVGKKEGDPQIGSLVKGGVAEQIGLKPLDVISKIEVLKEGDVQASYEISHYRFIQKHVNENAGNLLRLTVLRDGETLKIEGKPAAVSESELKRPIGVLGIYPVVKAYPFWQSFVEGAKVTWELSLRTLKGLWGMITGEEDSKQLGGLFMIAKGAHDSVEQGWSFFFEFMAILSLNLGIINLFPIPMLDGGHILFYLVEALCGRPVPEKVQDVFFKMGMCVLIGLMVFSHWNDISRFGFIEKIMKLFS